MTKEEEFQKNLLAAFKIEAQEHVSGISAGLLALERQPPPDGQREIMEVIFREMHSLKGDARAVNLSHIELVCQAMEGFFAVLKRGKMALSTSLFDLLNDAIDVVQKLIPLSDAALTHEDRLKVQTINEKLADAAKGEMPPENKAAPAGGAAPHPPPNLPLEGGGSKSAEPPAGVLPPLQGEGGDGVGSDISADRKQAPSPNLPLEGGGSKSAETIRIPAVKLDSLLLKAEELVSAKLAARRHADMARELRAMFNAWKGQWSKVASGNRTISQQELLALNQDFSRDMEGKLLGLRKVADEDFRSIGGMVDNLLDDMKNVMMFPFSSVLGAFPKLVRDISREQGKETELTIQGSDIEIDKRILQEIKDPLIHLARNGIDHGIEAKETRKKKNKPEKGSLKIVVSQKDSGKIEIMIADDGAGINLDRIRASALKLGIITAGQTTALSREETLALIFESGITTSAIITTVSGRGLGMAIVREKIEKLGGTISIKTAPDEGTLFSILLPLSLATFRGILVQTGGRTFAVPTMNVERIQRLPWSDVRMVENRETILLHGKAVSLVRLDQVLELPHKPAAEEEPYITVMVLSTGDKYLAFAIDEMLYEDEILLKNLGNQLSRVRNILGATVLGSGKVIPILNVSDLVKSALKISAGGVRMAATEKGETEAKTQSILVVEDSIISRTLFVNILESAGYNVAAAVDGVDGFTKLAAGDFELVVSDIQMPRMDGFELTQKIRADRRLGGTPVVIVSGLESPEDKKRGIEVGANAYIVKSGFDQSNLLEVIKRLI